MKLQRLFLLPAVLLALLGNASAQESDASDWIKSPAMGNYKAYAEFKMANYEVARQIWETLAGLGNPDALFNLGVLAEDGLGETKDMKKALALYEAAANAGGFKAQYRLGMLYSDGGTVVTDEAKARHFLSLAAVNGDKEAAARLASLDQPNRPISEFEQAERLSSRGQQAGDAEAQYAIAVMYRTGKGQPQDREQSLTWLKRSAGQNYPAAVAAMAAEVGGSH